MAEQRYSRESTLRGEPAAPGAGKCCAYNRTRERFLSAEVEAGDFPAEGLDLRLANITPGSGAALWMFPFRGVSPTSVRAPLDLIYLDRNSVVIEAVEMFPIATASPTARPAASVLALPAHTIASIGTQAGDQLILCPPEEMKQRLRQLLTEKAEPQADAGTAEASLRSGSARVLPWVDRSRTRPASETPAVEIEPVAAPHSPEPVAVPELAPRIPEIDAAEPEAPRPEPDAPAPQKANPWRTACAISAARDSTSIPRSAGIPARSSA